MKFWLCHVNYWVQITYNTVLIYCGDSPMTPKHTNMTIKRLIHWVYSDVPHMVDVSAANVKLLGQG